MIDFSKKGVVNFLGILAIVAAAGVFIWMANQQDAGVLQYAAATNIPKYPIIRMYCSEAGYSSCTVGDHAFTSRRFKFGTGGEEKVVIFMGPDDGIKEDGSINVCYLTESENEPFLLIFDGGTSLKCTEKRAILRGGDILYKDGTKTGYIYEGISGYVNKPFACDPGQKKVNVFIKDGYTAYDTTGSMSGWSSGLSRPIACAYTSNIAGTVSLYKMKNNVNNDYILAVGSGKDEFSAGYSELGSLGYVFLNDALNPKGHCKDLSCNYGETKTTCPNDCGDCGDGIIQQPNGDKITEECDSGAGNAYDCNNNAGDCSYCEAGTCISKTKKSTAPLPTVDGSLPQGDLNYIGCDYFSGWVCDKDAPGLTRPIDIYANDVPAAVIPQEVTGQDTDAAVAGICGGNSMHGFHFTTPVEFKNGQTMKVDFYGIGAPPFANNNALIDSTVDPSGNPNFLCQPICGDGYCLPNVENSINDNRFCCNDCGGNGACSTGQVCDYSGGKCVTSTACDGGVGLISDGAGGCKCENEGEKYCYDPAAGITHCYETSSCPTEPPCFYGQTICGDGQCHDNCDGIVQGDGCTNDGECETGEGCECEDCFDEQDSCRETLVCDSAAKDCRCPAGMLPNNGICVCNSGLACNDGTCVDNPNQCTDTVCGNSILGVNEECDPTALPSPFHEGDTCNSLDSRYNAGPGLGCFAEGTPNECKYNTEGCAVMPGLSLLQWKLSDNTGEIETITQGSSVKLVAEKGGLPGLPATVTFNIYKGSGTGIIATLTNNSHALSGKASAVWTPGSDNTGSDYWFSVDGIEGQSGMLRIRILSGGGVIFNRCGDYNDLGEQACKLDIHDAYLEDPMAVEFDCTEEDSCYCEWGTDEDDNEFCGFHGTSRNWGDSSGPITPCTITTTCDACIDGVQTCTSILLDGDPRCNDENFLLECGISLAEMPFFGWIEFIISALGVVVIYTFILRRKKE